MNKEGIKLLTAFLLIICIFSFVSAQEEEADLSIIIDDAQQCIMDEIGDDCSQLSADELSFAIQALGDYEDCGDELNDSSRIPREGQQCWPSSACRLKETALATFALYQLGEDTQPAINWLLNHTTIASDLEWYLQTTIINNEPATCTVTYDSVSTEFSIDEIGTLSGEFSGCLSISQETTRLPGSILKISTKESCITKQYKVSCDKDFTTNLLYYTPGSAITYVSQFINDGAAEDEVFEEVRYKCFEQSGNCNYEGSLWATAALKFAESGTAYATYLPYLIAGAEENQNLLPSAFLYKLGKEDYQEQLLSEFGTQYWGTGSEKFYKTALAFYALESGDEITTAKDYLLQDGVAGDDGCWGNVADTGFLLITGWPNSLPDYRNEPDPEPYEAGSCYSEGKTCEDEDECIDAGGDILDFTCSDSSKVCCSEEVLKDTCNDLDGYLCDYDQECLGSELVDSRESDNGEICCEIQCTPIEDEECFADSDCEFDEVCDDGECILESNPPFEGCLSNDECDEGQKCKEGECVDKKSLLWLWIILALIVIGILLYVFRNKIKFIKFKKQSKVKKGPAPKPTQPRTFPPRPQMPPRGLPTRPSQARPRAVFSQPTRKPIPEKSKVKDNEFEDTLKKLREMSK